MEILEIHMSHFGKFTNQNMVFHPGVNIIYGENESGKSTMRAFIRAMFYGIARGRGRAAAADEYSVRQPWENGAWFAGMMRFESGGKIFRVERSFSSQQKEAILFCETDGEELDMEQGDLQMLLEEMDEASFDNTVFFGNTSAETGEDLANALRNHMMNVSNGGAQRVDVTQALEELQTERKRLEREKKQCMTQRIEQLRESSVKMEYAQQEMEELAKEEQKYREKLKDFSGDPQNQEEENIDAIFEAIEREGSSGLKIWKIGKIAMAVIAAAALVSALILTDVPARIGAAAVILLACAGVIGFNQKDQMQKEELRARQTARREQALQAAYARQRARINQQKAEAPKRQRLMLNLEWVSSARKEKMAQYRKLQEEYEMLQQENGALKELEEKISAVYLAIDTLTEVSSELYQEYSKKLNLRVSRILAEITGGKYTGISLDENFQVCIQTPKKLLSIWQVSRGSMEQIYFALRMACADLMMPEEKLPVILDDAFLTYDDTRLERTLRWLAQSGHQVLLFTCHKREQEIMQKIYD